EPEEGGAAEHAPAPPEGPPPLQTQVEACFSDEHLRCDRHLQELISDSPGGWVDLEAVLALRQLRGLRARPADVLRALAGSWLQVWRDPDGTSAALRRPPERGPLPALEAPAPAAARRRQRPAVEVAGAAVPADAAPAAGQVILPGRMRGTVVHFDEEAGSASISCQQTQALFQKHVHAEWRELEQAGASDIGAAVSFRVEVCGAGGQPRAREVRLLEEAPADLQEQPEGADCEGDGAGGARPAAGEGAEDDRYTGQIKSFHEGIGVGFISCRALRATFGRDVALNQEDRAGFGVGDAVSFALDVDDVGTPKATRLRAAGASVPAAASAPTKRPAPQPPAAAGALPPKRKSDAVAVPSGKRHKGFVRSFDEALGVGRLARSLAGGGPELPVSAAELAGFAVGDCVSFAFGADPAGRKQAVDLEAEEAPDLLASWRKSGRGGLWGALFGLVGAEAGPRGRRRRSRSSLQTSVGPRDRQAEDRGESLQCGLERS
ncbi:unnamed protein product, partial [Prorocentrum cordatum]